MKRHYDENGTEIDDLRVAETPLFDEPNPEVTPPLAAPYNGTGGAAGSATSYARATHDVESGKLGERQERVMRFLRNIGRPGLTCAEVCAMLEIHHGTASGLLSNLHAEGLVFRRVTPRNGQEPYVAREFRHGLADSECVDAPQRNARKVSASDVASAVALLESAMASANITITGNIADSLARIKGLL